MRTRLNELLEKLSGGYTPQKFQGICVWESWYLPDTPQKWGEWLKRFVQENHLYPYQWVEAVQRDWTEGSGNDFRYHHSLEVAFSNLSKKQRKSGLKNPLGNKAKVEGASVAFHHSY